MGVPCGKPERAAFGGDQASASSAARPPQRVLRPSRDPFGRSAVEDAATSPYHTTQFCPFPAANACSPARRLRSSARIDRSFLSYASRRGGRAYCSESCEGSATARKDAVGHSGFPVASTGTPRVCGVPACQPLEMAALERRPGSSGAATFRGREDGRRELGWLPTAFLLAKGGSAADRVR